MAAENRNLGAGSGDMKPGATATARGSIRGFPSGAQKMGLPAFSMPQSHGTGSDRRDRGFARRYKITKPANCPKPGKTRLSQAPTAISRREADLRAIADALIAAKESNGATKSIGRNGVHRHGIRRVSALRPVDEIDTAAVLAVLTPLWQRTGNRLARARPDRGGLGRGKAQAIARARPAVMADHLAHLLAKRGKLMRGHHAGWTITTCCFRRQVARRDAIAAMALDFAF